MSAEMKSVKIASGEESVKTTATDLTAQTGKTKKFAEKNHGMGIKSLSKITTLSTVYGQNDNRNFC